MKHFNGEHNTSLVWVRKGIESAVDVQGRDVLGMSAFMRLTLAANYANCAPVTAEVETG